MPAVMAGLIAGVVLLVVPRGSPWSALTFFTPVITGRVIPELWGLPHTASVMIHLILSILYGLAVGAVVSGVTQLRALILGGAVGLGLYLLNVGIVTVWMPGLRGAEFSVAFTHVVFGLIAGGAYRGLLQRRVARRTVDH